MTNKSETFRQSIDEILGYQSYDTLINNLHERGIDVDDYFIELLSNTMRIIMNERKTIENLREINRNLLMEL